MKRSEIERCMLEAVIESAETLLSSQRCQQNDESASQEDSDAA